MRFTDFESRMSVARMRRYLNACNGDTRKAMTLYRLNLALSLDLFAQISLFEVALRNAIDLHFQVMLGHNWLTDAIAPGGCFSGPQFKHTSESIRDAARKLGGTATTDQLVATLGFGFWRYLFAPYQFSATGSSLLAVFPERPLSSSVQHYNARYFFNELASVNRLRNRIAHHEPICFVPRNSCINTNYARSHLLLIHNLLRWMGTHPGELFYGLDHTPAICSGIDKLALLQTN
ncbi:MAG: Abi family protein [Bacteroidia bacterium]